MIELIMRLFLSAVSGGLIGYEREKNGRPAGIRTHLLVCLGSCLTMIVSLSLSDHSVGVDASRIASMVMAGIGFLGAGVIVKVKNGNVWGLTTAACLWVTAALGLSIGCGLYLPSILTVFISIISLMVLKSIENYIRRDSYYRLEIHCNYSKHILESIKEILTFKKAKILDVSFEKDKINNLSKYTICIKAKNNINNYFIEYISNIEGVEKVSCE